jgi:hypothetical protein
MWMWLTSGLYRRQPGSQGLLDRREGSSVKPSSTTSAAWIPANSKREGHPREGGMRRDEGGLRGDDGAEIAR